MSSKNKSQLRTENSNNFPNNNTGFITPEKLRSFNGDMIDSMLISADSSSFITNPLNDNLQVNGNITASGHISASTYYGDGSNLSGVATTIDTGSFFTTGSVSNATLTFTQGDGSTVVLTVNNVTNATSASHAEQADNATSASHAEQADNATSASVVTDSNIAYINKNNTFTGTQNFNNISVSGTGSFGRIESVTGSAKIIGDAFVVVNADTPTLRYAGLQVYDSGSSSTASLEWDGDKDSWILVEEGGQSSFILTGPTGSKGSEVDLTNNKLPKAGVHRQLVNSNITDDGSTVTIGSDLNVTGTYKGFDSGSFAILNQANTFTAGPQQISGSTGFLTQTFDIPGSNQEKKLFDVKSANINGVAYNRVFQGFADYPSYGDAYKDYFAFEYYDSTGYNFGSEISLNGLITTQLTIASGSNAFNGARFRTQDNNDGTTTADIRGNTINLGSGGGNNSINIGRSTTTGNIVGNFTFASGYTTTINGNVNPTGLISSSNAISASAFIGDGSQLTGIDAGIFKATGSFQATTNDLQVTGSFGVSKAIGGKNTDLTISSNTASIDLTTSNTFTVTLVDSADTHLDVSTFGEDAQSVNVLVKQPNSGNTGSISFSPDFKFGQGADFLPTPALNAEDIISFTRFGNHLYGTFINNFS